jgi:hypothetical protein
MVSMSKRKQLPPARRIDWMAAAFQLKWRLAAAEEVDDTDTLQCVAAWVISYFHPGAEDEALFLGMLGLEKKPTPQGNWSIVYAPKKESVSEQ